MWKRFLRDQSGATAIEYCLVASLIAVAIVTGVGVLSASLDAKYAFIASALPAR